MKRKLDLPSLAIGIVLSVAVTGFYDAIFNYFMGLYFKANLALYTAQEWASMYAAIASILIILPLLYFLGFLKREPEEDSE